jgi:diacylglycerol O-acyltransferase / wax synthase
VMRGRGLGRHLEMVEFALVDLRRAAAAAGGTVNDGFVASLTGGLRRYHERKSQPVETLRLTLPISIRRKDDPLGGNRITLMRVVVPVSETNPARRIPEIHELCSTARHERSLAYTNAIAGTLNLLPAGFLGSILKHVDFVASDVPGFPFPVYLAGALLERYVAFGPTIGAAVNETLLSYNGRCCVGVTLDTAAVEDSDLFVESLREGFEEVLALAGDHEPVLLPLSSRTVAAG